MKYEDTLGSRRPPRKPGYRSPPQQAPAEESWRRAFSKQLIAALEDAASVEKQPQTAEQLAKAAHDKLQFDFPLVSEPELEALITVLRMALDRGSWPPLPLTAMLLRNVLEGSHPAPQPAGPVADATPPAACGASAAAANGHGSAGSGNAGSSDAGSSMSSPAAVTSRHLQQQNATVAPEKQRMQPLYQQLAACLIVKLARRALEAPPREAYVQLASFAPDAEAVAAGGADAASMPQQLAPADREEPAAAAAAAAAVAVSTALPVNAAAAADAASGQPGVPRVRPHMAEPVMAAQEDGDDCEYEDLQPLPLPPPQGQRAPGQPGGGRGNYTWEVLQAKLAAITAHARYSNFAGADAWQQLRLADDVVALLAAITQHERSDGLTAVSSVYLDMLAERVADVPAAVVAFEPLCAALGATEAAKPAARGIPPPMPQGLHAAASFAARAFATLLPTPGTSQQAGAAGTTAADRAATDSRAAAARSLARGVYAALLPPLGAWLGAVAAATGGAAAKAGAAAKRAAAESASAAAGSPQLSAPAGKGAGSAAAAVHPAAAAESGTEGDVRLACRVVAAAILGAQAAGGNSKALLDSGVFRALVVLFAARRFSDLHELGTTVLLAASSDAALAAWAAAVPAFVPALIQPCFEAGGVAAAEGAVWGHLLPAAKRPPTLPALEQLLSVDAATDDAAQQIMLLRSTLLLLADCRTAGGGRRPWGAAADARLRALPAELNALDMRLPAAAGAARGAAGTAGSAAPALAVAALPAGPARPPASGAQATDGAAPDAAVAAADEPPSHRAARAASDDAQQHQGAQAAALRRACRECAALAKDLAAGQQAAAKRD